MPSEINLLNLVSALSIEEIRFLAFGKRLPVDATDDDFLIAVKIKNLAGLEFGKRQGWFSNHDGSNPIHVDATIPFDEWKEQTMAHIMAHLKWFPSVSQARKNGWDKPVEKGIFKVAKKQLEIK